MTLTVFNYDELVNRYQQIQSGGYARVGMPSSVSDFMSTIVHLTTKEQRMPLVKSILYHLFCFLGEMHGFSHIQTNLEYIRDLSDEDAYQAIGELIMKKQKEYQSRYNNPIDSLNKMQLLYISFQWFDGLVQFKKPVSTPTVGRIKRTSKVKPNNSLFFSEKNPQQRKEILNQLRFDVGLLLNEVNDELLSRCSFP